MSRMISVSVPLETSDVLSWTTLRQYEMQWSNESDKASSFIKQEPTIKIAPKVRNWRLNIETYFLIL